MSGMATTSGWSPTPARAGREWWFPVAGIGGLTTATREAALRLETEVDPRGKDSRVRLGVSANRVLPGATIRLTAAGGVLLETRADLAPGKPYNQLLKGIAADSAGLAGMRLTVTAAEGAIVLDYCRPDRNPGRTEYTPFTSQLERPQRRPEELSTEELVLAAETRLKEMHAATGTEYLRLALAQDPGHSLAHEHLGLFHLEAGAPDSAAQHLAAAAERNPYSDRAHYYLALARLQLADSLRAERQLYFISRSGAFHGPAEGLLGRLALLRGDREGAQGHLAEAALSNGGDLTARTLLALVHRLEGEREAALARLAEVEAVDPTDRWAAAERWLLGGDPEAESRLARLLGGQSQEAIELALDYRSAGRYGGSPGRAGAGGAPQRRPLGHPADLPLPPGLVSAGPRPRGRGPGCFSPGPGGWGQPGPPPLPSREPGAVAGGAGGRLQRWGRLLPARLPALFPGAARGGDRAVGAGSAARAGAFQPAPVPGAGALRKRHGGSTVPPCTWRRRCACGRNTSALSPT